MAKEIFSEIDWQEIAELVREINTPGDQYTVSDADSYDMSSLFSDNPCNSNS